MLQNLKFFNKKGYELTPLNLSGVYTFKVLLEPVSQNLFETEHLYIFEEVFKRVSTSVNNNINHRDYLNEKSSTLYKFLSKIRDLNNINQIATSDSLQDIFILDEIFKDEPLDYAKKIQNYVTINFDDYYYFELTLAGINFIETYEKDIQEQELESQGYKKYLVHPRLNIIPNANEESYLMFRWKDRTDDKIMLFDVSSGTESFSSKYSINNKKFEDEFPIIIPFNNSDIDFRTNSKWKDLSNKYRFDSGVFDEFYTETYQQRLLGLDTPINLEPFQLNIAINSETPGQINRTLEVLVYRKRKDFLNNTFNEDIFKIIEIEFFGEVVAEEERFTNLLENFGRKIDQEDFYVFKDFDLDDDNLDYIKINEKRKELLLEGDDIFTYLGTYKSLRSVFKWLGYKDITFREYFYNIKTFDPKNNIIHYKSVDFDVDFKDKFEFTEGQNIYPYLKYGEILTSEIWKKTTRYGLIYKYNEYVDDDLYGDPVVNELSNFSPEEMLIKLYGLKKFLYKYFLPHNARIINITAEGLYFTKIRLQTWRDINHTTKISKGPDFDFTVVEPVSNLVDVDDLLTSVCFKDLKLKEKISDWVNLENKEDNSFLSNYKNFPIKTFINNYVDEYKNKKTFISIQDILDCDTLKNKLEYYLDNNFKKVGFFIFDLNLKEIKIQDVNVPINFFKVDGVECAVIDYNNEPGSPDTEIDTKIWELGYCGDTYPDTIYTFDNFLFSQTQIIEWTIESKDGRFIKTEKGFLKDLKRIFTFVPYIGFYNVSIKIYDHSGFPLVKKKIDYVEVVDDIYDIVAFGRFVLEPTIENLKDYKIDEISSNVSDNIFCPLKSSIDELDIEIDVLKYSNYLKQEYHHPFIKSVELKDINRLSKEITLQPCEFYNDYYLNKNNFKNNFKAVLVNYDQAKLLDEKVFDVKRNKIYTKNSPDWKKGEYIQLYEKYVISNFSINNNTIIVSGALYNKFRNGTLIELVQDGVGIENRNKTFKIIDIQIDFINKLAHLTIDDDGSLDFKYTFEHNNEFDYRYAFWSKLVYRINEQTLFIKDVTFDDDIDNYVIELDGVWKNIKKLDLQYLYIRYGIIQGEYEIDITDNILTKNQDGSITINVKDFEYFCKIDTNFKFLWSDFDLLKCKYQTYLDNLIHKKIDDVSFKMLKYQTPDTLEFHSAPITGFKIKNVDRLNFPLLINNQLEYDRIGKIIIDIPTYNKQEIYEIKLPRPTQPFLNKQQSVEFKHKFVQDYLNNIKEGILSNYYFIRKGNRYVEAIQKPNTNVPFIKIRTEVVTTNETDNYPKYNWVDNNMIEWKGLNNPPNHLHLYSRWNSNSTDYRILEKSLQNSFNISETFIKKKSFAAPIGTPMFITIDRKKDFDLDRYEFNWKFFNEETNELYLRSKLHYFTWWFLENGIYGLELEIFDKLTETTRTIKKRSFIEIR